MTPTRAVKGRSKGQGAGASASEENAVSQDVMGAVPEGMWLRGLAGGESSSDPASMRRNILWVGENFLDPSIGPEDAPTKLAGTLLACFRSQYPDSLKQLYSMLVKLMPTKAQVEDEEDRFDADRNVDRAIRRAERAAQQAYRGGSRGDR